MLLWPGAATRPSAVSKFCGILGNGRGFDPYVNVTQSHSSCELFKITQELSLYVYSRG